MGFHTFTAALYISDILGDLAGAFPPSTWVLVRSLDSTRDLVELQSLASQHGIISNVDGVPAALLPKLAAARQLFSHFDELWFFVTQPKHFAVDPAQAQLTSDAIDLNACARWEGLDPLAAAGAFLAIGDGDFANIVASDEAMHRLPLSVRKP